MTAMFAVASSRRNEPLRAEVEALRSEVRALREAIAALRDDPGLRALARVLTAEAAP